MKKALFFLLFTLGVCNFTYASEPRMVDARYKYAWSDTIGWIDLRPTSAEMLVFADHLEGYLWSDIVGQIAMGSVSNQSAHTYANTTSANWGVNIDSGGNLLGYAWNEKIGWIEFNTTKSQVTIDLNSGEFSGYAWNKHVGWISFGETDFSVRLTDTLPNPFSFGDLTEEARSTTLESNDINISGITADASISISGTDCLYSINHGAFTDINGTISNEQNVTLQVTTATSYSTTVECNLTIGGVSDIWSVATSAAPTPAPAPSTSSGGGGVGYTPPSSYSTPIGGGSGTLDYASSYGSSYVDGDRVISNGATSLTIPSDSSESLVLSSGSGESSSTFKLPRDVDATLNRDGSFTISLALSGGGTITLGGGEDNIDLSASNGAVNSIEIPRSATVVMSNAGAISSLFTLNTPYGVGSAHTLIDPLTNSITTTFTIEGRLYSFTTRAVGSGASIAIFQGEETNRAKADETLFYGLKSTFTASETFLLNEEENGTTITPATSATFEERIYWSGERTIMLVDGEASMSTQETTEAMKAASEYLFSLDSYTKADIFDAESRYSDNTLFLGRGWNLITPPVEKAIDVALFMGATVWEYEKETEAWKNPTILESKKGYWVKSEEVQNIEINGSSYILEDADISQGWNLLGAGEEIIEGKIMYDFLGVYVYRDYRWILDPIVIYRGEGFWGWKGEIGTIR